MAELNSLTLTQLRDGFRAGEFSAREIAESFNAAVGAARALNAYTVETPDDALVPELNQILGWVEQLATVDTEGVEPLTAVIEQKLRLRDDVVDDGDVRDKVLLNAPDAQHGFFAVPKVIE